VSLTLVTSEYPHYDNWCNQSVLARIVRSCSPILWLLSKYNTTRVFLATHVLQNVVRTLTTGVARFHHCTDWLGSLTNRLATLDRKIAALFRNRPFVWLWDLLLRRSTQGVLLYFRPFGWFDAVGGFCHLWQRYVMWLMIWDVGWFLVLFWKYRGSFYGCF
jgi:hypothetical protein